MSQVYMAERAEKPRGLSRPPGAPGTCSPHLEGPVRWAKLPLRRRQAQRRARTEPLPVAGPMAGLAARPAELREVPTGPVGRGRPHARWRNRHCFLHWLRLGPRFLPSQSPAAFPVVAVLGLPPNSPLCRVHWR